MNDVTYLQINRMCCGDQAKCNENNLVHGWCFVDFRLLSGEMICGLWLFNVQFGYLYFFLCYLRNLKFAIEAN